jgi:hypothetical protein
MTASAAPGSWGKGAACSTTPGLKSSGCSGVVGKGRSHFGGNHEGGVLSAGGKLLGQGEHGGGFATLAGGMDDK